MGRENGSHVPLSRDLGFSLQHRLYARHVQDERHDDDQRGARRRRSRWWAGWRSRRQAGWWSWRWSGWQAGSAACAARKVKLAATIVQAGFSPKLKHRAESTKPLRG